MKTKLKTTALLAVLVVSFTSSNVYADRASIALRLFKLNDKSLLNYDYNAFGWNPSSSTACSGYRGGHSGLDIQTKDKSTSKPFYALAGGRVIYAGGGSYNTIAVYDGSKTTLYLHASKVSIGNGKTVSPGTLLGYQGSKGAPSVSAIHVHLEVRSGQTTSPSCGASYSGNPNPNINPESVF